MSRISPYRIIFTDVDVVWFKDPLEYFHDEHSPSHGFDVYFQVSLPLLCLKLASSRHL